MTDATVNLPEGGPITVIDGVYALRQKIGTGGMSSVFLADVDLLRFDYTTLYAYTQVQGANHSERRRKAEDLAARLRERTVDLATMRVVLEEQGIPTPEAQVAVKVCTGTVDPARFEAEWKNLLCLNHENVVKVYGGGVYGGRQYYAMELLRGLVPPARIRSEFSIRQKIEILCQAGRGLQYLHDNGIIHRDIKPDNMVCCETMLDTYVTKVTDLGLGKDTNEELGLTQTNVVMGTPFYLSPEQAASAKNVDHRTDIYSFGASLYEFVTGQRPYHNKTSVYEILAAVIKGETPIDPKVHDADIPDALVGIITCAMARNLDERYPSMTDLVADLERYLAEESGDLTLSQKFQAGDKAKSRVSLGGQYAFEKIRRRKERHKGAQAAAAAARAQVTGVAAAPRPPAAPAAEAMPGGAPPKKGLPPLLLGAGIAALVALIAGGIFVYQAVNRPPPAGRQAPPPVTRSAPGSLEGERTREPSPALTPPAKSPAAAPMGKQDHEAEAIIRAVNTILLDGVKRDATQIELRPAADRVSLRYTTPAGETEAPGPAVKDYPSVVRRLKVMSGISLIDTQSALSGWYDIKAMGKSLAVRVTTTPGPAGDTVLLKLSPGQAPAPAGPTAPAKTAALDLATAGQQLCQAAADGDFAAAKALLEKYPDAVRTTTTNKHGASPLHFAARMNHPDVAELLVAKGADVNVAAANGYRPLHDAADGGSREIVALLLANQARLDFKDKTGKTPLDCALRAGQKGVAELLSLSSAEFRKRYDAGEFGKPGSAAAAPAATTPTPALANNKEGVPSMEELLNRMIAKGASDLYLEVGKPPTVRAKGVLEPLAKADLSAADTAKLAGAIVDGNMRQRLEANGVVRFGFGFGNRGAFAVNVTKAGDSVRLELHRIMPLDELVAGAVTIGLCTVTKENADGTVTVRVDEAVKGPLAGSVNLTGQCGFGATAKPLNQGLKTGEQVLAFLYAGNAVGGATALLPVQGKTVAAGHIRGFTGGTYDEKLDVRRLPLAEALKQVQAVLNAPK